jgi:hypothetical protein
MLRHYRAGEGIKVTNMTPIKKQVSKPKIPKQKRAPENPRVKKPPQVPSLDELIAESKALGMNDVAKALEKVRYLESPKGQKFLERRERRLSRL